jgi:hypothetical protein
MMITDPPPPLLSLLLTAGGTGGGVIGYYLAPVGDEFVFPTIGFVVGVFAAGLIYAYFRPPGP